MPASCVLRQEVLDTDAAIPNPNLLLLPLSLSLNVLNCHLQRVREGTICVPVPCASFLIMLANSFLFFSSHLVMSAPPLAFFVPLSTCPVGIHELGGVFHHAFSHCYFARPLLHALLRDLLVFGPCSGRGRAA